MVVAPTSRPHHSRWTLSENACEVLAWAIFALTAFLHFSYLGFPFHSDEGDNILGGLGASEGRWIYSHFFSQHTPLAYYYVAIAHLAFGWFQPWQFRIGIAVLLWGSYVLMHLRYRRDFGRLTFPLVSLAYCLTFSLFLGTSVLADFFSGLAALWGFGETYWAWGRREVKTSSLAIFSTAAFVAPMSTFISVYVDAIFAVFWVIAFASGRWTLSLRGRSLSRGQALAALAAALAFPYLVTFAILAIGENLKPAFEQAYFFNTHVYSRYNGGLGSSPLAVVYRTPIEFMHEFGYTPLRHPSLTGVGRTNLAVFIAVGVFLVQCGLRRELPIGALLLLLLIYGNIRGWAGFHATVKYQLGYFLVALVPARACATFGAWSARRGISRIFISLACVPALLLVVRTKEGGLNSMFLNFPLRTDFSGYRNELDPLATWIQPDDLVFDMSLNNNFGLNRGKIWPGFGNAAVPWVWEVYEDRMIADIVHLKPVAVHVGASWKSFDSVFSEYGRKTLTHLKTHYVSCPRWPEVWVLRARAAATCPHLDRRMFIRD